jgi:hypothetical protein
VCVFKKCPNVNVAFAQSAVLSGRLSRRKNTQRGEKRSILPVISDLIEQISQGQHQRVGFFKSGPFC